MSTHNLYIQSQPQAAILHHAGSHTSSEATIKETILSLEAKASETLNTLILTMKIKSKYFSAAQPNLILQALSEQVSKLIHALEVYYYINEKIYYSQVLDDIFEELPHLAPKGYFNDRR